MAKPVANLGEYTDILRRSGLVSAEDFEDSISEFAATATAANPQDYLAMGRWLVERKLLTPWQNNHLLEGRHKGFFLGKYKLFDFLGSGGMSTVYLAQHVMMRRLVAIKVVLESQVTDLALARFRRECQVVASLDHDNIVRAHDFDSDGKFRFLVMEYIDGPDLQQLVEKQGPPPYLTAADYIRQAAEGLQHAHEAGLVHRDIKPANLLRDQQGVIKILDLGVARLMAEGEVALTIDRLEGMLGTVDYLSPEQALDCHEVDARSDIYSLGCSLYFLLTGHAPFPRGTQAQKLLHHQVKQPPSVYKDRPDAPPGLVGICQRMMSKKPEERFPTAADVAQALERWATPYRKQQGSPNVIEASQPIKTQDQATSDTHSAKKPETVVVKKEAMMRVVCEGCGSAFRTAARASKRQVDCPKCGHPIMLSTPPALNA